MLFARHLLHSLLQILSYIDVVGIGMEMGKG